MPKCIPKVIIFDLDDTIGHFEEVAIFLNGLQIIIGKRQIPDKYIFKLLDLWPKFLRPGIMEIFEIIKTEKKKNSCIKAVIYTNNMGPRSWTLLIRRYIEKKLRYKLFDKVITAYRPFEATNKRTTHSKTYSDLLRSTNYGKDATFIFLDDQSHPFMRHPKIKYMHLYAYNYGIPFNKMIKSFLASKLGYIIPKSEKEKFKSYMYRYLTSGNEYTKYKIKRTRINKTDIRQFQLIRKALFKFLHINKTRNNRRKKPRRNGSRQTRKDD
jgi:hypothetical protein